ncbi:MAG: helix-turn-helix transcriptional regulator [Oscillospiraceae bacterium]|nr:helix-turn-helix transcriptional regulator [Oscillospiraceae bacterium]
MIIKQIMGSCQGGEIGYWSNYERGQHELPVRYLVEFCRHYRVSADYLLGLPRGMEWPRG